MNIRSLSEDYRQALDDVRGALRPLLGFQITFSLLRAWGLVPLSAWILGAIQARSGRVSLSNAEILHFLLSPLGALTVVVAVALTLFVSYLELTGLVVLGAGAQTGQTVGFVGALSTTLARTRTLTRLAVRQAALLAATAVPFLAALGLVYVGLLSDHDINYFLAERPPVFTLALVVGGLIAATGAGVLARLLVDWCLSAPYAVLRQCTPATAMQLSSESVAPRRKQVAVLLVGWTVAMALLGSIATGALALTSGWVLDRITGSFVTLAATVTLLVTLFAALGLVLSFVSSTGLGMLVARLFAAAEPDNAARLAAVARQPTPQWVLRLTRGRGLVATAGVLLVVGIGISTVTVINLDLADQVAITAHRGSSVKAPENSLAAIRQAIEDGADYAEIDVQETADGAIVMLHDADLMRIAGINRGIWDIDSAELADIDSGSWFGPEFADERIATLQQVIDVARDRIKLNIEIKYNGHDVALAERVVEIVRRNRFEDQCVVSSLDYEGLMQVKELAPELRVGFIAGASISDVTRLPVDFLSLNMSLVDEVLLASAGARGIEVHVWTVNQPRDMSRMIDRGVDNILTDLPDVLAQMLADRAAMTDAEVLVIKFRNWVAR